MPAGCLHEDDDCDCAKRIAEQKKESGDDARRRLAEATELLALYHPPHAYPKFHMCPGCTFLGRASTPTAEPPLRAFETACPFCSKVFVANPGMPGASRPTALDAATVEACAKEVEQGAVLHLLRSEDFHAVVDARSKLAAAVRALAEPKASPESPPPAGPVCASWCGTTAPHEQGLRVDKLNATLFFCTDACMDARRPLHPEVPR